MSELRCSSLWPIPLAALLFMLPALCLGGGGTDLIYHLLWQEHFSRQFWSGDLYPRWLDGMNAGCGSPTFYYYPPLPYYLGSLFAFLNHIQPAYWYPLAVVFWLMMTFAGLAMYGWLRPHAGHLGALLASVIYLFLPYPAAVFYGALLYSYGFSFLWSPLLLLLTDRLFDGKPRAFLWFALVFAGLFFSTIPGTIVVGPLPFIYAALMKDFKLGKYVLLALSSVLGIALSAIYLIPMWVLMPEASVGATNMMWEGPGNFRRGLFFTHETLTFSAANIMLMVSTCAMAGAVLLILYKIQQADRLVVTKARKWAIFFFLVFFMYLPISEPVWEVIPILKIVQMPSRLMVLTTIAFAVLCALLIKAKESALKPDVVVWHVLLISGAVLLPLHASYSLFSRYDVNNPETTKESTHISRKALFYPYASVPGFEYLPSRVPVAYFSWADAPAGLERLKAKCQASAVYAEPALPVRINHTAEGWRLSMPAAKQDIRVTLPLFYFPGWSGVSQDRHVRILPASEGWLLVEAPASDTPYEILLTRTSVPAERFGGLISAVGGVIWGMLWGFGYTRRLSSRKK